MAVDTTPDPWKISDLDKGKRGSSPPFRTPQLCEVPQGRQSSVLGLRSSLGLSCPDVVPYFCPSRRSGTTMVGTTNEFVGYDRAVTYEAGAQILDRSRRIVPALAGARVTKIRR